ncbi:PAS domain S-box-containing protein [Bradyrhizobium erythrophlei]|nr:PAS domain S-box-containing protein [Bradyrhizobium erythrophlei]
MSLEKFTAEEVLWQDDQRVVYRKARGAKGDGHGVLVMLSAAEHPTPDYLNRVTNEYGLRGDLDEAWAARPLELLRERGGAILLLKDPGGEPLDRLIGAPMDIGIFLRLAVALSAAVCRLHERGLLHKDIKPKHVLVDSASGRAWLTGFGIASRLPRQRQPPDPPEIIAGTLAYMAPEQTGRMNRSIDSRSDLYSLGVTFYQMLTGSLPFTASDPMEWVHCHIARKAVAPIERLENVPAPVSAIIMKLLAKTAEDRYQTAAGVDSDLRRGLAEWEARCHISAFPLGEHDTPDRLLIPEKLYGRASETGALLASFNRVVASGTPELVLVSGYSGIGKSSVVNELQKVFVSPRGLFASGKFDQYKRDIPYATLVQALQSLVRPLLSKSEAELRDWRDALKKALGTNGLLMVDLVPELKFVIGEQSPVPAFPPQDAQRRFQLVFRRFISVFARPEHPLVLFLDDLQWLDAATLDLIEDLLSHRDMRHLMLIGAYRDNEVDSTHPLTRKLEAIRNAGARVQEVVLAPMAREDLKQLIEDSLRCEPDRAAPLARLLHEKTAGNPFFAIQFLSSLAEEGLLTFRSREARWSWDLERIHAKGYTDNVLDLMVEKLHRLPAEAQNALQQLACLGNSADSKLLAVICAASEEEIHDALREAVQAGLVLSSEHAYRFLHDRVQEAAYSVIPEESRAAAHLRIGRLLLSHIPPERQEDAIFEIVNQFNRAAGLISSLDEREQVAKLNLIAGQRAKASAAHAAALTYFMAGAELLAEEAWERQRDLVFSIELHSAECEFLTGQSMAAENRLAMLSTRAMSTIELAVVTCLRVDLYTILDDFDRAVAVCLDYLRYLGIDWSAHPTEEEARREYDYVWSLLGSRAIESLIQLPLMTNPTSLSTMDVLTRIMSAVFIADENLSSLVICRMINLSLEHGNSDASCFAYVWFAIIAGPRFGNYKAGWNFGRLGYELVEKRGLTRYQARTYMCFGNMVLPWMEHIRNARDLLNRAFDIASEKGDLTFAAYGSNYLVTNLIAAGDPLAEVQRQTQNSLEFAQKVRFGLVIDNLTAQLGFIRTLRGLTRKFGSFDEPEFDELRFERHLAGNRILASPEFRYWVRKVQAHFFAGEHAAAVAASYRAERLLWSSTSHFETAEFRFYSALAHAVRWDSAVADEKRQHFDVLMIHRTFLELWAENCPENFENRAALVRAEIARIEGRHFDAMRSYEQAIRSARANGFVHNEALANELAARFYLAHGFDKIAHAYLRDARDCYLQWGADGKVRQLENLNPHLRPEMPLRDPTSTILTSVEQLDLATVIRLSQAISGEIALERLIDTLMRTAIENAGAERGLLILARGDEYQIVAEATTGSDAVAVGPRQTNVTAADLPVSVLNYVVRTKARVLLDDVLRENPFSSDEYIHRHQARSILCLPLVKQTTLVGALYFENNLTGHVFTPARMAVLTLLASEAAISLENIRLYDDLRDREAKIRRLVDSNIVGVFSWELEGQILEANDAFLRTVGHDRADLVSGRMRWTDMTPPDWLSLDRRKWIPQLKMCGSLEPFEKEFFRKDGSRVPVLIGLANVDEDGKQGVAFVLDLTERKRVETEAHESEQRYRDVQMELAHANRVATMGQLTASIAHEVKQPIGAAVAYAQAALRFLGRRSPELGKVRETLEAIVETGHRAADVIDGIRALIKKAPTRSERLDVNEAILEVIELVRGEAMRSGTSVQADLAEGLPLVEGDRVQLQQVILNLAINAIEAMSVTSDRTRELLISTRKAEPSSVLVEVRDSGPGLVPGTLEHLFDAFYTTKPGGLGMGLSICRSIIEAHGGRLGASNFAPQGAVFHFTLPKSGQDDA